MTRWLLDPGHGGMAWSYYATPGKRSPAVPPGVYEGNFNRRIAQLVRGYAGAHRTIITTPGPVRVPLGARVKWVNKLCAEFDDVALVSIHANAVGRRGRWVESASGWRVFHALRASSRSLQLASHMEIAFRHSKIPYGTRGPIVGRPFRVLQFTRCPAILVECGFMTNRRDASFMASDYGQRVIARTICDAMEAYNG